MKILDKYNVAVPRYTSYPPANYFEQNPLERYIEVLDRSNSEGHKNISLYFHIPFCRHLCHYCGCNSHVLPKDNTSERYLTALHKEIEMVIERLNKGRKISQIHFGGGTPTLLATKELGAIVDKFRDRFLFTSDAEIAIECHPAYIDREYWLGLVDVGFNRISIGVQDFDNRVLKSVNRIASLLELEEIFTILRDAGIFINIDLIYGLPHQSRESFSATIERVAALAPDRVVTFSYAHVPWVNPRQMELERIGLPEVKLKSELYDLACEILTKAGYMALGLDHFVLPSDELARALVSCNLHRNFQGYTTRVATGQVYAFGVSAISQIDAAFYQNDKSIDGYIAKIEAGELAYDKGYILSWQQQIISDTITTLMCNKQIEWSEVAQRWSITKSELLEILNYDKPMLSELEDDGIIVLSDNRIEVTSMGTRYIRNVAAALDPLMRQSDKSFSKSL